MHSLINQSQSETQKDLHAPVNLIQRDECALKRVSFQTTVCGVTLTHLGLETLNTFSIYDVTVRSLTAENFAIHHSKHMRSEAGGIDLEVGAIKREVMDWCGGRLGLVTGDFHGWRCELSTG